MSEVYHTVNNTIYASPPNDIDKELYFNTNKCGYYFVSFFSLISIFAGLWLYAISNYKFYVFSLLICYLMVYLYVSYFIALFGKEFNKDEHNMIKDKYNQISIYPTIDIFLPCCGEDINILKNTYKYVSMIDYPNYIVWVLDDSNNDNIKILANSFEFNYVVRDDRPHLKKAGNIRNAFNISNGEFFIIFDADFCPRPDFIKELLPYMYHDPKIGIVQSPQFFKYYKNKNWIERAAGSIQELFYRLTQVNRNTFNASICVGTSALYRREPLINFGGTAAIEHSEDVHTGFNITCVGWKVRYVPVILSAGICPDTASTFFNQQYRWGSGSTSLFFNRNFWKSPLSKTQKICYLSGMFYYISCLFEIFMFKVPLISLMILTPENVKYYNLSFLILPFINQFIITPLWATSNAKIDFNILKLQIIQRYAYGFAIKDKLFNSQLEWIPSGNNKSSKKTRYIQARILCACVEIISITLLTIFGILRINQGYKLRDYLPSILVLLIDSFVSIFFIFNL